MSADPGGAAAPPIVLLQIKHAEREREKKRPSSCLRAASVCYHSDSCFLLAVVGGRRQVRVELFGCVQLGTSADATC